MWRKCVAAFSFIAMSMISDAQSAEDIDRILSLCGYDSPEELDEYEVERLHAYLERPFKINLASVSSMRSCGIFSPFQTASLLDYRSRHGDIMSLQELSSIDGFTEDIARRIAPFISLDGGSLHSYRSGFSPVSVDIASRGGARFADGAVSGGYALKGRIDAGDALSVSVSSSYPYSEMFNLPEVYSGCIDFKPRRIPLRLIAGDFNARFGQGLALWNGMSMTGLQKVSSFFMRTSGLSSSWSFTGSSAHTGLACEYSFSRFRLSALASFPQLKKDGFKAVDILPAANLCWHGRNASVSVTHYQELVQADQEHIAYIKDMKTSADVSMCLDGVDLFAESAYDWVNSAAASLAGVIFPLAEDVSMAMHARYYPSSFNPSRSSAPRSVSKCSNEAGLSLACDYAPFSRMFNGALCLDASYLPASKVPETESIQVKVSADGDISISERSTLKLKLSHRSRTWGRRFRTEARADFLWNKSEFSASARIDLLHCASLGFLGYIEVGYKTRTLYLYMKQSVFIVDNWDDRIYAYERDIPGNFSVPAFYGRGLASSMILSWKFSRWGRLYLKGSLSSYPFMDGQKKKPGRAELKLQLAFSF